MAKWNYNIVFNDFQKKYIVFKENEKGTYFTGIFKSDKKKECAEFIKQIKMEENK